MTTFLDKLQQTTEPQALLDERDSGGRTFLHYAALANELATLKHIKQLEHLIIPVNIQDGQGQTALHLALQSKHVKFAEIVLLIPGVSIGLEDHFGRIPLHWAIQANAVQLLPSLTFGVTEDNDSLTTRLINQQTTTGDTPLHWAAADERLDCATFLIKNGADVTIRNSRDEDPLAIAQRLKNNSLITLLEDAATQSCKRSRDSQIETEVVSSHSHEHAATYTPKPVVSDLPKKKLTIKLRKL
jgi:euchromatic histone-lysine N-methyltransferase